MLRMTYMYTIMIGETMGPRLHALISLVTTSQTLFLSDRKSVGKGLIGGDMDYGTYTIQCTIKYADSTVVSFGALKQTLSDGLESP